jgi:hypothetical protein
VCERGDKKMIVKRILLQHAIKVKDLIQLLKTLPDDYVLIIEDNQLKIINKGDIAKNKSEMYIGVLDMYNEEIKKYPIMNDEKFEVKEVEL